MARHLAPLLPLDPLDGETDDALIRVYRAFQQADPTGTRLGQMMRNTLDQLYDGQRTGRYSWEQLHKTERTHFGTLFEINLRREFADVIDEGHHLDYRISGHDVDCKFSQSMGGWMIPPEAYDHLLVVGYVNDAAVQYAFGVVRATAHHRRVKTNRDAKTQLSPAGRAAIRWIHRPGELPPNVLLHCDPRDIAAIFAHPTSGQQRINELFRRITHRRISRTVIATVAQQADYMKRVRSNGGARSTLRDEGYIILGDWAAHRTLAHQLALPIPRKGEMISARVVPAHEHDPHTIMLDNILWRTARPTETVSTPAPLIPHA